MSAEQWVDFGLAALIVGSVLGIAGDMWASRQRVAPRPAESEQERIDRQFSEITARLEHPSGRVER